ncbi:efflux RND transporter periplasmic adaptor subunit [Uliginosibacterium gangwonense]|uniref:efflux RND transporter periplasmic adaptor subunit n=1 Tax=Uliginosibacterium gangwonense TaxID=392736 RepID=UPI0012F7377B|nr:efflux RND transporter periplasmic adaptor subunit [Uliginosibacterium gangwonense]
MYSPLKRISVLLSAAMALILAACQSGSQESQQQVQQQAPVVNVQLIVPQSVALDTELAGRTNASTIAEVRPQVGGIIEKRLFEEGSEVKAGQPLYQIAQATYRASYESAEANVVTLRLKAQRYKELAANDAVGQQDYDDIVASLKQAEAALQTAKINLDYTHVYAPVAGRIGKSSVTVGALVTADQSTALATVQQLDPIYVDVTRSSRELLALQNQLANGAIKAAGENAARVKLTLEDGSEYPLEGKLQFSEMSVNTSTGSVTLRAIFPNPKHRLLPGMFVKARLVEGINEKAILVQQNYVSHNAKGKAIVIIVGKDGKAEEREVQTTRSVGNMWLVSAGLKAGDQLITGGLQYAQPGTPVQIASASAPAALPAK